MNKVSWNKVQTAIDEILDLPKEEQLAYIEKKYQHSEELKLEITELLQSISDSEGWLENPDTYRSELLFSSSHDSYAPDMTGQKIGAYRLKNLIGHGGMGSVFLAEREDGNFSQTVSLKLVRREMATPSNKARFRREQQILAGLSHANIARLYDGGVSSDGLPYLVMEYVDGKPITKYCDDNKLTVHERIELFKQVCRAVQYAHSNLVIHRDLKPDNIFVTGNGQVKVLDFGIAKLLDPEPDSSIMQTQEGSRILTLHFAAPEQVTGDKLTTSVDIYALGNLFFQLIAGIQPFDLRDKERKEIEDIITYTAAPNPARRFSGLPGKNKLEIAEKRSARSAELADELGSDLAAIVHKTLRKEPEARYKSAGNLLEDLDRFLQNMPVTARDGTLRYHLGKFARRHKAAIISVIIVFSMMLSFGLFYTYQITQERNKAQLESKKATQIKNFTLDIFNSHNPNLPDYSGKDISAHELLESGLGKVESELTGQPELYIEMLGVIGSAFKNIDAYELSDQALNKALGRSNEIFGNQSLQSAGIMAELSVLERVRGNYNRAEELISQTIRIKEEEQEDTDLSASYAIYGFVKAQQGMYHEAEQILKKADSLYVASGQGESVDRNTTLSNLSEVHRKLNNYEEAEKLLRQSLEFFENYYNGPHLNIATNLGKLGALYHGVGRYEEAEEVLLSALESKIELLGEQNSSVADTYEVITLNYRIMGDLAKAEEYAIKNMDLNYLLYDENSVKVARSLNILSLLQADSGDYQMAESNYHKTINIMRETLDENHPSLAITLYNLAHLYSIQEKYIEARDLFEQVVEMDKIRLGPRHREVAVDLNKLAGVHRELGELAKADSIYREAGPIFYEEFPENHYRVAEYLVDYGKLKLLQEKFTEAKEDFDNALQIFRSNFDEDHTYIKEVVAIMNEHYNSADISP
ncbi:MAG: serine/threonine-protein kinase [Balneolaceae bacterium]